MGGNRTCAHGKVSRKKYEKKKEKTTRQVKRFAYRIREKKGRREAELEKKRKERGERHLVRPLRERGATRVTN